MKISILFLTLMLSAYSHAFVMDGSVSMCNGNTLSRSVSCSVYTTISLPTMIVDDVSNEIVWDIHNEQLLAQYRAELNGSSPIYAIKHYADIKTNGNVDAAIDEIKKNIQILESVQK